MPYFSIAFAAFSGVDLALVGERLQRRHRDVVAVHLEEAAQRRAVVAAAEAVGAEHHVRRARPTRRIWSANERM